MKKIHESPLLIRLLNQTSSVFARRRGLPVIVGVALVVISMLFALLNLALNSPGVAALQIIFHHVGVITALVGLLLSQPLGN